MLIGLFICKMSAKRRLVEAIAVALFISNVYYSLTVVAPLEKSVGAADVVLLDSLEALRVAHQVSIGILVSLLATYAVLYKIAVPFEKVKSE
jgi:hypothetical protein